MKHLLPSLFSLLLCVGCHPFESLDEFPSGEDDVLDVTEKDVHEDVSSDMPADSDVCVCPDVEGAPCPCPGDVIDPDTALDVEPDATVDVEKDDEEDLVKDVEDAEMTCACPSELPFDAVCDPETCEVTCNFGRTWCASDATCVDTRTDPLHCGECDKPCSTAPAPNAQDGQVCVGGSCTLGCDIGFGDCDDDPTTCETQLSANPNCGECGRTCDNGGACTSNGAGGFECVCKIGQIYCPELGGCVSNTSDESCGADCGSLGRCEGASTCLNHKCESCPGIGTCSGGQVCTDLGGCFCEADPLCLPPDTCCTDGCQNLTNTDRDCGCEHRDCASLGKICCQGGCTNPDVDPFNCGGCGSVCGQDQVCEGGGCTN